jgi:KDO2-lipid IV(A) lauroyltransferase
VKTNGERLRRFAYWGARYGPKAFVKHSPTLIGAMFALLLPELRRRVRANLRRFQGIQTPWVETQDVLRTFVSYAHCLAESLGADRPEALATAPEIVGGERLLTVLAEGKGAVIVTAHTGAWDVAARFLASEGAGEVAIIMSKEPDAGARALQDSIRGRTGVRVLHVGDHPVDALPALRHLRQGGLLAVQLDRAPSSTPSVTVPLSGEPIDVPIGPFRLASLGGVPVIPVFTRRLGYFHYEIVVGEPIRLPSRASEDDVRRAAVAAVGEMERFIAASPTQWFHFSG